MRRGRGGEDADARTSPISDASLFVPRILDVELRRRGGKVAGRASLVARAARGCLAAASDALGDVGKGGRDQSSSEDRD